MVVRVPAEIVHQVAEYKKRKKPIIQLTKVAEDSCSEEDLMPQVVPGELEHLKQIAHGKESYFSISFCGDTGSGKTFLLAEILDFLKAEQQPLLVDGDMPEIAMTGDIECFIHKEKLFFDMEGPKGTIPLMQLIPEDALQEELQVQISDEEEKQRQRAVGKYFPRLALAFSHTFVYVTTQNPLRHQDACDELLDLAKALNPALTANAKPFLIIVWNQAELGKYVKKGQDGRLRDVELTEQLGNNEERKKMLELSFGRTQIITFPNKHISKRDLHGSELFDEKMAYFISLLEMHRFELNKMRLREGLELPARALLTIIPELVKQSVGGLIPSVPRALKEYMLQHPDEDQNVLKEVFLDLGRKSKVRCGKAEGALKEWRATSIRLSMLIAARNLAFRFLSEGVEAFPKEDQNARARSLYSKLLVYFKMVFCECQAKYPQSETDGGAPVYCKKEHHGHGSEHTTERPVSGILHLVLRSLFGPYHDSWKGEFELSEEDKKQLDEDLPAEMQQRTSTAALIWHRNNDENLEKHFKNFAQEGVSLLADYAERYSATSGDVPLRPNVAKRSRIDFHMDPLDPFCVACYQQVEGEVQTFVLCEGCYCAWSRRVTQLYKTVESGPQLYATGKDGFVYGQAVSDASADRNWRLRRIGLNLSGKILSVACSCEKTYVVLRPVASDKGTEILKPCLFQLDRSGDNPDVPILPPPSQEPARVALHRDMIYLVTQTGGLFSAPAPPTPVDWKPIYEPGFLKGSPWPIRSIAFHEDHVYILQGHLRAFKSTLYQVPVSNLSNIKAWKAVGDLEASTSVAAADDALFFTTSVAERAGGNIHRVPLPLDGKEIHLASQNLVSPHSSGFTSVAFVASGDEVRSFLEPIPSQDDWVLDEIEVNLEDDAAGTCVLDAPVAAVRGSAVSERFRGAWRSVIDAIHITYRGPDGQEIPAGSANAAQPGGTGEKP